MEIFEERTVGPSLGRDNISKGFHATLWGFTAIVVFMSIYYVVFGIISALALAVNLLLLIALLSLLQATLTLPGIAAIALTLGMAIDANVLINERIREELRGGATPQAAIAAAWRGSRSATRLGSELTMEFFKIRRTIPFMRHALIFNVISLITFLAAVFFLVHKGLNFSIEFTGGTVLEVQYSEPTDVDH